MGVLCAEWSTFAMRLQCTQQHRQAIVWQGQTEQEGKGEENKGISKGKSKGTKGAKVRTRAKHRKSGLSGLENSKSEARSDTQESAQTCPIDTSWNDGWNCDEWNDDWSFDEWNDLWSSVGWHEGCEQM